MFANSAEASKLYLGEANCNIEISQMLDPDLIPPNQLQQIRNDGMRVIEHIRLLQPQLSYAQCVAALQRNCVALKVSEQPFLLEIGIYLGNAKISNYSCISLESNEPIPEIEPDPSPDLYPDFDNPWIKNYQDSPNVEPVGAPQNSAIKVPPYEWVMNYVRNNWQTFALGLILSLLALAATYFGGNAFLAFITGGASLPSMGATAPIFAALVVAILMRHGHLKDLPDNIPTASVEDLIMEIDEETQEMCLSGKVNGTLIERRCVDIDEITMLYFEIQKELEASGNSSENLNKDSNSQQATLQK